jgi:O-succinylbenzoic acid--CoA ligase
MLSVDAINYSTNATHEFLGGPGEWVCTLPAHYVAGMLTIARGIIGGCGYRFGDPDLHDLPQASKRSYISLVPAQLHKALRSPRHVELLGGYAAILLGGASIPPGMLEQAAEAGLNVVTTYGMAETCGGCVYNGTPLPGVSLDFEPGTGRVLITTPTAFLGYRLDPKRTAATLIESGTDPARVRSRDYARDDEVGKFRDDEVSSPRHPARQSQDLRGDPDQTCAPTNNPTPTVITNDRGHIAHGKLAIDGRMDDIVICGGENVDLAQIQRLADARFGTGEDERVVVLAVPDDRFGTHIGAVTRSRKSAQGVDALNSELGRAARIRDTRVLNGPIHTASGKIDRKRLLAQLWKGINGNTQ